MAGGGGGVGRGWGGDGEGVRDGGTFLSYIILIFHYEHFPSAIPLFFFFFFLLRRIDKTSIHI
jgi:hypothetical protein